MLIRAGDATERMQSYGRVVMQMATVRRRRRRPSYACTTAGAYEWGTHKERARASKHLPAARDRRKERAMRAAIVRARRTRTIASCVRPANVSLAGRSPARSPCVRRIARQTARAAESSRKQTHNDTRCSLFRARRLVHRTMRRVVRRGDRKWRKLSAPTLFALCSRRRAIGFIPAVVCKTNEYFASGRAGR